MIRTLIVVHVPFYREGLEHLLAKNPDMQVVGATSRAGEAERLTRHERPDVVLLDIGAPDAVDALERLRMVEPRPRIVALAVSETPESVVQWAESGVAAYVPREASVEDLMRVIRGAVRDELYCSPRVAATLAQRLAALASSPGRAKPSVEALSAREQEVLALIAEGLSNKAIAARLRISSATAKNHVHNILEKLQLRGRVEAASLAQRRSGSFDSLRGP